MKHDPAKHDRRSIRLKGYDYTSPGAYFVTICVQGRECILGEVVDGEMKPSDWGRIAAESWAWLPERYPTVTVDAWTVMPNHTHAIITIHDRAGHHNRRGGSRGMDGSRCTGGSHCTGGSRTARTSHGRLDCTGGSRCTGRSRTTPTAKQKPLGRLVGAFKTVSTKRINQSRDTPGARFWQRNYWEHIIRDETTYRHIHRYIETNPARWEDDRLHPDAPPNPFNRG